MNDRIPTLNEPIFLDDAGGIQNHFLKPTGPLFLFEDSRTALAKLPGETFQTCVTSPPYWGLRNYDAENQLGMELDPRAFIDAMVSVFAEVKRVLRNDGIFWLNIGDSYTSGNRKYRDSDKKLPARGMAFRAPTPAGWKDKELVGIPWRLAQALQENGWYLRADIIWYKPNCMPESVRDRVTRSHEYIFMLTKSERYYYNYELTKETNGRNWRTLWEINTEPCSVAHFATFPKELVRRCLLASTKKNDWVLDPFAGSGTTAIVSDQMERHSVGLELNPDYRKVILERFSLEGYKLTSSRPKRTLKLQKGQQSLLPELTL